MTTYFPPGHPSPARLTELCIQAPELTSDVESPVYEATIYWGGNGDEEDHEVSSDPMVIWRYIEKHRQPGETVGIRIERMVPASPHPLELTYQDRVNPR
jgi:hypothetical protein